MNSVSQMPTGVWQSIKRIFVEKPLAVWQRVTARVDHDEEDKKILAQKLGALKISFAEAQRHQDDKDAEYLDKVSADIQALLEQDTHTWEDFYAIERLLVNLYDEQKLDAEIKIKMGDVANLLSEASYQMYWELMQDLPPASDAAQGGPKRHAKQIFLSRLLNDIQWIYTKRYAKRSYARKVRGRIAQSFVVFALLFVVFGHVVKMFLLHDAAFPYPMSFTVAIGLWGASFSLLLGLNNELENRTLTELRLLHTWEFILSRIFIGGGAALILYFFLGAGAINTDMLPHLDDNGFPDSPKSFALLVIWSFLAGFSEKLVPNLLRNTAEKTARSSGGGGGNQG